MSMCLLTMNDARIGVPLLSSNRSSSPDICLATSCHQQASKALTQNCADRTSIAVASQIKPNSTPSTSCSNTNMVVQLTGFFPGVHHPDPESCFSGVQTGPIALLPVRLATDHCGSSEPVVNGHVPIQAHLSPSVSSVYHSRTPLDVLSPPMRAVGSHCACCMYNTNITRSVMSAHNNQVPFEPSRSDINPLMGQNTSTSAFNNVPQHLNQCDPQMTYNINADNDKQCVSHDGSQVKWVLNCVMCNLEMQHCLHSKISRHQHIEKTKDFDAIYENSSIEGIQGGQTHIPRIVCHSPRPTSATTDSGISSPTVPDQSSVAGPQLCTGRDFYQSSSFQEHDMSQQIAQMAGGHLSIQQSPSSRQNRHSTGSVQDSLQNELNSISITNKETAKIGHTVLEMAPFSHQGGLVFEQNSFQPLDMHQGTRSASPIFQHVSSTNTVSDESNSGKTTMTSVSFNSGLGVERSDERRASSASISSGDSNGDCSGFSIVSWAKQFNGAVENALYWKTLQMSTNRISMCGFYYENMSMEQAKLMLTPLSVGSFLLRDSSNKHFLFSLSAKTPRGVTSVRIEYRNALFRLDSDEKCASQMPGFDCILKLIQHYVELSESKRTKKCVWFESNGRKDTPVTLTRPVTQGISSLMHFCRKALHKTFTMEKMSRNLKTDFTLLQYLKEYPYSV